MSGLKQLHGDTDLLRGCLLLAGFMPEADDEIFNDAKSFGRSERRLKLWDAESIYDAPAPRYGRLQDYIRQAFGDRLVDVRFIFGRTDYNFTYMVSLGVWLKD